MNVTTPGGLVQGFVQVDPSSGAPMSVDAQKRSHVVVDSQYSLDTTTGGTSQVVAVSSAASAASTVINSTYAIVSPTVDIAIRQGAAPVAVNDGTDQVLFGGAHYRVTLTSGNKLGFKAMSSSGNVYITPGA